MSGPGLISLRDKANLVPGRLSMGGTQPLLAPYDTLTLQTAQQTKCYQEVAPYFVREGNPTLGPLTPHDDFCACLVTLWHCANLFNCSTFLIFQNLSPIPQFCMRNTNYDHINND